MKTPVLSLRFLLLGIFLISVVVPAVFVMVALPSSYRSIAATERQVLNDSILNLVDKYLDDYMDSMEQMTLLPLISPDFIETLKERDPPPTPQGLLSRRSSDDRMMLMLYDFMSIFRKDIESWVFITADGTGFSVSRKWGSSYIRDGYDYRNSDWYKKALAADGRAVYIDPHRQDYLAEPTVPKVFSVARAIRDKDTLGPRGVIMVDQNTLALDRMLGNLSMGVTTQFLIADSQGQLLYSNKPLPGELSRLLGPAPDYRLLQNHYEVMSRTNERAGWRLHTLLSRRDLDQRTFQIYLVGILFLLGNLIFGFAAFLALSRAITKPIARIGGALKEVEKGDLSIRLEERGPRETRELQRAIHSMLDRIQHLVTVEYQSKIDLREAEYRALLAQVQPHFLYNVLYCLLGLNQVGRTKDLEAAVYDLHDMLRYTLESNAWTTLKDEAEFLVHYCTLQRLRFEERFSFSVTVAPGTEHVKIPRLLLQPLVENAIVHGVEPLTRPCKLEVTASLEGSAVGPVLRVVVTDDGVGFDPESPAVTGHGLGTALVRERLKNSYTGARYEVSSSPNLGTRVTVEVPL